MLEEHLLIVSVNFILALVIRNAREMIEQVHEVRQSLFNQLTTATIINFKFCEKD